MEQYTLIPYPLYIVRYVRANMGLEMDDMSRDDEIAMMSKSEVFQRACEWNGLIHMSERIKSWIEDVYNIQL